jgi:uncharacterized protein with ParB-like and HNH nuclease domain
MIIIINKEVIKMKFTDIPQFTRQGNWECNFDIQNFVEQIEEWEKEDGLQLNPDFQRGHVWTEKQQISFMEFTLKGGTTGRVIYLNHPGWMGNFQGDFVCVDGLQRITAVKRFIHNEIKIYNHYFKEFEGSHRMINDMKINVNNLKTRKEVLQWYLEMNGGGVIHTKEELDKVRKLLEKEI